MHDMRQITGHLLSALSILAVGSLCQPRNAGATPLEAPQVPAMAEGMDAGTPQAADTATIVFITVPNVSATVTWGKKLLGKIAPGKPLVVVRPRDSGPLDVMVRASGYLAVQTRAHTFSDTRVLVKLTPPDKKSELLGYRIPIDAGADAADGALGSFAGEAGTYVPSDAGAPFAAPPPAPVRDF